MNWSEVTELIRESKSFEGTLYRGPQSTRTILHSSPQVLEIGPIEWELPKKVKLSRPEKKWFYEQEGEWKAWEGAEAQGVPVLSLLDPRLYTQFQAKKESEQSLASDAAILRFSFATPLLFTVMGLPEELFVWCIELAGEIHEVAFIWRGKSLVAITQRDFWLTDEPITVLFHKGVVIPGPVLNAALR